ncbi:MAG: phytoene desaturase family protein, partial [Steroidobacteraceae bacterium]
HIGIQFNPLLRDNELNLRDYGLEYLHPDPVTHVPFLDGASITLWQDPERTIASIAALSAADAKTFRRLFQQRRKFTSIPASERARAPDAWFWDRIASMSGYDAVRCLFESDYLRAANLACGRIKGPPGSDPGTGMQALSLVDTVIAGRPTPKGGSGMLTVALARVLEKRHSVILTNKSVVRLIVEKGRCKGVECSDGSRYRADKAVISTIHVRHLVGMAPDTLWGDEFREEVRLLQPEQAMFAFHYALKEPPRFPLAKGGTVESCEAAVLNSPERILRLNYDDARGEVKLDDLPLQIVCESVADPSRVPPGSGTMKIMGVLPYGLKEGPQHWDVIKDQVAESIRGYFQRFAPNITPDKVLGKFLLSPLDLERMDPAMWRGSAHEVDGRFGFAPYRTPIPGLYQTGSCTAPGGSITGLPGRATASLVLEDLGTSLAAVVAAS